MAVGANDADTALLAQLAVPNREPVKLVAVTLPLIPSEPVTVWTSVIALPIFTPVFVTWNSTPLPVTTVNEPEIMVLPLTSSLALGDVVSIPTLPPSKAYKLSPVPVPKLTYPSPAAFLPPRTRP